MELFGKHYVVFGVANDKSICWPIAHALDELGAKIQLVSHPSMQERVDKLIEENGMPLPAIYCDVTVPESLDTCFAQLAELAPLYGIVHGIAFSDKNELRGNFIDVSLHNFLQTMHVSCYSFIEIARRSQPLMTDGGSILTLTFDASRGSYPHYNVMGLAKAALEMAVNYTATDLGAHQIRVNAIAASPENTLSARGISNFRLIGDFAEAMSPMGRRATLTEIAHTAAFLLSPLGSGITGQTIFVDCGASVPRMPPARNAGHMATAMGKIAEVYREKNPG